MRKIFKVNPLDHSFIRPTLLLEKRNGDVIGKLIYEDFNFHISAKGVDEFSITVHKVNDDIECSFWEDIKDLAIINWQGYARFVADVSGEESTETTKSITCTSLEGDELGQLIIRNFHVNDKEAVTVLDQDGNFSPTYLFVREDRKHSLIDRVLNLKTKHWQVGTVSPLFNVNGHVYKPSNLQREFTVDGQTPYDFLEGNVSKECGCTFVYDTYNRLVNCYNTEECVYDTETMDVVDDVYYDLDNEGFYQYENGSKVYVTGNYGYCAGIGSDTTILLTRDRLSESVSITTDKDSIKNCFYVTGGDDVVTQYVAASNASGSNYIYNFDYQYDLMPDELVTALNNYQTFYDAKQKQYTKHGGVFVYDPKVYYDSNRDLYLKQLGQSPSPGTDRIVIDEDVKIVSNKICVLNPYAYYENGHCYTEDGELITDTYTYVEPGLFIKYCQAVDRLSYWEHEKAPYSTPVETTAEAQMAVIRSYFQSNALVITNACNPTSFSHVTLLLNNMCTILTDNRYTVTIDKDSCTCAEINNNAGKTQGYWQGKISIVRDTNELDHVEVDDFRVLVKKSQNGNEDLDYCNQKVALALAKMDVSELPLTYNMTTTDSDARLREIFSAYNLTSLRGFRESFASCQSVLDDLKSQLLSTDDNRQDFLSRAFDTAYQIYENRKNICIEYSGTPANERTSASTQVGITEAIVNKWQAEVDTLTLQVAEFQQSVSLETYLGDLYEDLLAYIREDEYNNSNYNSDGLTDSELLDRANELRNVATKELKNASKIHYTLDGTINNIFNIKELETVKDNFELFNYVRYMADGKIFKLRLLEISGDENSLDKIDVTFSDVVSLTNLPGNDIREELQSAKSMATTYSATTLQARQGSNAYSTVDKMKTEGLNSAEYVIRNSTAGITHDDHGSLYKNMDDTSVFSDHQLRITPSGMYLTDDAWKTTGMAVGTIIMTNPDTGVKQKYFGVIGDYVYGTLMAGKTLQIANENGSVNITGDGIELDGGSITWKTKLPQSSVTDLVDDLAELDDRTNQALTEARQGIADAAGALARANAVDTAAQGYANTAESNAKNASDPRGSASSAESNAKTYADDKDSALSTALTTAYQNYTDTAVANLDTEVGKYLGLGGTTIVSDTYLVSPYIGGGYLNITNGQKQVIIDPKNLGNTNYIFAVKNGSEFTVGIKADGTTNIKGGITATSLTITDQTKVTGMKIPKTYTYAYANSITNSQPADSAFSSTQNPEPGKYMWIRTTISYTDSTITPDKNYYSTYIGKNGTDGKDGTNGTNGNDGASVTAVRVMYARSSSNSTAPTSGWSETRPTLTSTYKYVWVREDYKYSTAPNTWVLGTPRFDSIITAECGVPLVVESTSTGVKVHPIDNTSDYLHITSDSVNVAINNYTKAHFGSDGIWIGGKSNTSATSDSYAFKVDTNGNGYFAGELKAATGSFSGTINAAAGEFTKSFEVKIPIGEGLAWEERFKSYPNGFEIGTFIIEEMGDAARYQNFIKLLTENVWIHGGETYIDAETDIYIRPNRGEKGGMVYNRGDFYCNGDLFCGGYLKLSNSYYINDTNQGICTNGYLGVNGSGYTGYALSVDGNTYLNGNLKVTGTGVIKQLNDGGHQISMGWNGSELQVVIDSTRFKVSTTLIGPA